MEPTKASADDGLTVRAADDDDPRRRAKITAEIMRQTGIDEPMIERLVRTFYGRVRLDPMLGPVFAERVTDWNDHMARLCAFWSSVALLSGRYHGQPMQKHVRLPVDGAHFDRWLDLFEATAWEICPPAAAELFVDRARRIADSLEMGIATTHGRLHKPRHVTRADRL
jgi:hemoglobin